MISEDQADNQTITHAKCFKDKESSDEKIFRILCDYCFIYFIDL